MMFHSQTNALSPTVVPYTNPKRKRGRWRAPQGTFGIPSLTLRVSVLRGIAPSLTLRVSVARCRFDPVVFSEESPGKNHSRSCRTISSARSAPIIAPLPP